MTNDSLKNDLQNQLRTHEEKISTLKKEKAVVVAELKQRQAVAKTIKNQLAKLDGTAPKKHKQPKSKKVETKPTPQPSGPEKTNPSGSSTAPQPQQLKPQSTSSSEIEKNLTSL